jgi:hypothetical protein
MRPLPHSFHTILLSIVMLPFSYHLSLSHIVHIASISFVLEDLGATLLLQPLPLVIEKSFGGIMEYGIFSWCSMLL